jgi:hypothetical protein
MASLPSGFQAPGDDLIGSQEFDFHMAQKLNCQQVRWSLLLSLYDMKLVHVPRSQIVQSDTLSWRADLHPDEDNDNEDMMLLPDDLFEKVIDTEMHSLLVTALMKDDLVKLAVEALKTGGIPLIKSVLTNWKLEDGLLFFLGQCYVLPNETLQNQIVECYHDTLPLGHLRQFQTLELMHCDYWWPGMTIFMSQDARLVNR